MAKQMKQEIPVKKSISCSLREKKGFTLIEIIAVLVLLGILAAVAVPRFTNLQDKTREKAIQAAIAEVQARCSRIYANQILSNNGNSPAVTGITINVNLATNADYGGFTVSTTGATGSVNIEVTEVLGIATVGNNTYEWLLPGE